MDFSDERDDDIKPYPYFYEPMTFFLTKVSTSARIADASWKAVNLGAWRKEFVFPLDTFYGSLASEGGGGFLPELIESTNARIFFSKGFDMRNYFWL